MNTTTFDSTKTSLTDLLVQTGTGKIQLPDFQRGWVWDDEHICSLLASVSEAFPIGAIMMMNSGNADIRFKTRPIEGVILPSEVEPGYLILDGQQRLTSLYLSLRSNQPVLTKDSRKAIIKRWYYIDIVKALNPTVDREDAILSVPEDKIRRNLWGQIVEDYSSPEKEYAAKVFPLALIGDYFEWKSGYDEACDYNKEQLKLFNNFEKEVLKKFEHYQLPVITLGKETPKEAVCQVFEKVNTGGVSLTVFELLTATFAADGFQLRYDWTKQHSELRKHRVLTSIENTDFLQVISLLSTFDRKYSIPDTAVGCKRKDILNLKIDEYDNFSNFATTGFLKAAKFLHAQKIFDQRDLPYRTQLVPLAAAFAWLGDKADTDGAKKKIARWYWSGVLGELYGSSIETRFAKDFPELVDWINGGNEPTTLADASFRASRLLTLKTRNSAAYKGIAALLLREGGEDFRTGYPVDHQLYFDEKIDIHHIFPKDHCKSVGIDLNRCDCIVNKTPLSAKTNRMIGGRAPSEYLAKLQKSAGIDRERMDEILTSHVIDPLAIRDDSFNRFFGERMNTLINIVGNAMGKPVVLDLQSAPAEVIDESNEEVDIDDMED